MIHDQVQVLLAKWELVKTVETRMGPIRIDSNERLSQAEAQTRQSTLACFHPRYQFRVVAVDEDVNLL
ncbi:hypothetical protein CLV58_1158 [Spirosoma oryzae]|uniref:Uncharacterized protein n=1 Tax=Spirosoma oryzae TaxID=1469603 RepID=A0A2T0SNG0_9BACT|nr:hypothetical protein [Spirosoma oryzae]PRY34926.1 hypothetical protein CLV58_1158 [Spirosoma oryzae]